MALRDLLGSNVSGVARPASGLLRESLTAFARPVAGDAPPPVTTVSPPAVEAVLRPTFNPNVLVRPDLIPDVVRPGIIPNVTGVLRPPAQPTVATELARQAIDLLRSTPPAVLNDAMTAITNVSIAPENLMAFLARRVLVGEVLGARADRWSGETREDFVDALNLGTARNEQMDAIVALAILNDPDLEQEVRGENLTEPTDVELIGNRRVVWQHPPPGTPLEPPYVVLIAVERQDVAQAESAVQSIFGALGEQRGFRVPTAGGR